MKSIIRTIVAAGALLAASVAAQATDIRLNYFPVGDSLAVYVAKDQGFFEKRGLNVQLNIVSNQQVNISSLVAGSADMGVTAAVNALLADEAGIELATVANVQVTKTPNTFFTAMIPRTDSGIKEPKDLAGKKVAVISLKGVHHILAVRWLRQAGVAENQVTWVETPFPQMSDLLKSGQVDAVVSTDPFAQRMIDEKIGYSIGEIFNSIPAGESVMLFAAPRDWAKAHAADIENFRAALKEAVAYIATNEASARESFARWTKQPAEVVARARFPNMVVDISKEQLDFWLNEATLQGVTRGSADTAAMVGYK